ncbi:Extracellular Matrix protein PelB [Labilithrix luteola]|uniref:Extracellular Matrix protein PelB n=1 Tax=Labilithrix luteola TaxID=1391654 RepID=A0A0K1PK17_9BACT|nr:tetratricopeptide repeat protein [Labilithrix luteola]AKU93731.1 Extracellular Matrix protein PelB [Labilithrix luteola]
MRRAHSLRSNWSALSTLALLSLIWPVIAAADQPRRKAQTKSAAPSGASEASEPSGGGAYANALRLARQMHDDKLVAKLLAMQGLAKNASEADLQQVVQAHEIAGTPDVAVDFLRNRIKRFPTEKATRVILAKLLARSGHTNDAIVEWKALVARFGFDALTPQEGHAYARDLSRSGEVDAAYEILQKLRAQMPDDAKEYWEDLATLAWDRDEDADALVAYEKVYHVEPAALHAGQRLFALLSDAHRYDDAVKVALAEHKRTKDGAIVILAAHLRESENDWRGVRAILDSADKAPGNLHESAEYFLLRGELARQAGEGKTALKAYASALALQPDDGAIRAAYLWQALEVADDAEVRVRVVSWRSSARQQEALWMPMAVGLARIGRFEDAVAFFGLELRANPADPRVLLDFSEIFGRLGRRSVSDEMRRRAVAGLRKQMADALKRGRFTQEDLALIESTVSVVRDNDGVPQADRWMSALLGGTGAVEAPPDAQQQPQQPRKALRISGLRVPPGEEEMAADWYLSTGRPDFARPIVERSKTLDMSGRFRRYRLALALVDGDQSQMSRLLAEGGDLPVEDRVHALVSIDREPDAASVISQTLATDVVGAEEPMRDELQRIAERHRRIVRAGANYTLITGLDIAGPEVSMAHDLARGRIIYTASGVRMSDRGGVLVLDQPRFEGDGGALFRRTSARGVTEFGGAFNYQEGTPVVRASFFDQRLVTSRLGITTDVRIGSKIDDTSALRVGAVRNLASVQARYDLTRWYGSIEAEGREDQSRRYEHIAWDALGTAEAGFKILNREPSLSIGGMGQVSQRFNRKVEPADINALIPPRADIARALPPSFELVGGVIHFSRGDVTDRYRPDAAPYPRYDCEAAYGILLPDADPAVHVLCSASVRAPFGVASFLAFYNRGIAGIPNNDSAELALSYAFPF